MRIALKQKNGSLLVLGALFLVILIDNLGASLVLPVLAPLFLSKHSIFIGVNGHQYGNLLYGITLASFSFAMFFGAPILGDLSDRFGRKKTLMYCLWGTLIGYSISVIAILLKSPSIFIFGRLVDGFTAGSLPVAQAAIVDVSSEKNKVRYLGYILFAVSIAYIFGPLIGGVLSDSSLFHVFSPRLPFILIAVVSLLNILILRFSYKNTKIYSKPKRIIWLAGLKHFANAFTLPGTRKLVVIFLLLQLSWTCFFQFVLVYLIKHHQFSATQVSVFLAVLGIGMSFAFCYCAGKISNKFQPDLIVLFGFLIIAATIIILMLTSKFGLVCAAGFCSAVGYGCILGIDSLSEIITKKLSDKSFLN